MANRAIVWELALVVVAVAVFAVWQFVSLKRDGEALRRQREAASREREATRTSADDPP